MEDFDVDAQVGAVVDGFRAVAGVGPGLGDAGVGCGDVREPMDAAKAHRGE
ncbi:hypothetical protein OG264_38520 (plasmid) [Streptomyces xanthophaeus]|nr:hypothetical protein OG264_38520 [Streptomyces xanthophaeus]WST65885.1 hypothetical protein OG605_40165 [Streptomyces xanthophaeus]